MEGCDRRGRHVLPASAGMIPSLANLFSNNFGAPRIRGDDPLEVMGLGIMPCVLPASAGMIPLALIGIRRSRCAPRIRGDDPLAVHLGTERARCSPHPRG